MSDYDRILDRLDGIVDRIEALTRVVAVSSPLQTAFDGKSKTQQIKILSEMGLSNDIIALMVGSTSGSVSSTLSQIRSGKLKV